MYQHIFFDLDGTIIQSEFGIIDSVIETLAQFGIHETDRNALKKFIGPPLFYSFQEFCGFSDEDAQKAVTIYREIYDNGGLFRSPLYPAVEETLRRLNDANCKCSVVTSKPEETSRRIIDYLNLSKYFAFVIGPSKSDRAPEKKYLIQRALTAHQVSDKSACLMVGDRHYDIDGAKTCNIASVGVLYGYGTRKELQSAGADYLIASADELVGVVMGS